MASFGMRRARNFGERLGCELVVEVSDHSIETSMEVPGKGERVWDADLYRDGQVYRAGYANPIKPVVRIDESIEGLDKIDVIEDPDDQPNRGHIDVISSRVYKSYLDQKLISELVNPRKEWTLIVYGLIGLGILVFVNMLLTLYAGGGF